MWSSICEGQLWIDNGQIAAAITDASVEMVAYADSRLREAATVLESPAARVHASSPAGRSPLRTHCRLTLGACAMVLMRCSDSGTP